MKPRLLRVDLRWRDRPGLRSVLGLSISTLLLALLAWHLRGGASDTVVVPAAAKTPASAPLHDPSGHGSAAVRPALPLQLAAAQAQIPEGLIEVCGQAPIPRDKDAQEPSATLRRLEIETVEPEYRRWVSAMQQHTLPRVRAAGLVLAAQQAHGEQHLAAMEAMRACGKDPGCQRRVVEEGQEPDRTMQQAIDALARLALVAADTAVYALAAQVCAARPQPDGSPCQQLSIAQWARLDPDNLGAWLRLADQADAGKDLQLRAQALHRAAQASRQVHHEGLLIEALEATRGAGLHPLTQQRAQAAAVGVHGQWLAPQGHAAVRYCAPEQLHDSNRRQSCTALAETLTERGASLLELHLGIRIGERAGWSLQRVEALRESVAVMQAVGGRATVYENMSGCPAVEALQRYFVEWARHGELSTLRALAAGATPAEVAAAREFARRPRAPAAEATLPR